MGQALVTLPDGTKAQITFDSQDQLDATVSDLAKSHAAPQQSQPVTAVNRAGAFAGGFNSGVASILGTPVDTGQNIVDLGKAAIGTAYTAFTGKAPPNALMIQPRDNLPLSGDWIRNKLNQYGAGAASVPRPDDTASRYLAAAGGGTAYGMLGASTGTPMGNALATNVGGALSSQVAAENGAGPGGQLLSGMVGGTVANGARWGLAESVKHMMRGGEEGRQLTEDNIRTFNDAGTEPTVGQATERRGPRAAESILSKTPGAAGVMANKANEEAAQIGGKMDQLAGSLSNASGAEQAGASITRGITGEGGFKDQFKAKQEQLYGALDAQIAPDAKVSVSNTYDALQKLNADIPGAPALSRFFKNAKIQGIGSALESDTSQPSSLLQDLKGQTLPYEAVRKLRTLVGEAIADAGPNSDIPRSKWRPLYAALSQDLGSAAESAGPAAQQAWSRATTYTRAGMSRLDAIDHVINASGGPEGVYNAAMSGTKDGATTLRAVMQSLPPESQADVTATVMRRMGLAKAGQQNADGSKFSTETFLTNWNNLSEPAKQTLFSRYGSGFSRSMDQVAKVAANLREGSKVYANPSGTGGASAGLVALGTLLGAAARGDVATAGTILTGAGASNLSARLMTNPRFVNWLATTTKAPPQSLPSLTMQLAQNGNADEKAFAAALQQQIDNQSGK